jgi:hypothetical protein
MFNKILSVKGVTKSGRWETGDRNETSRARSERRSPWTIRRPSSSHRSDDVNPAHGTTVAKAGSMSRTPSEFPALERFILLLRLCARARPVTCDVLSESVHARRR